MVWCRLDSQLWLVNLVWSVKGKRRQKCSDSTFDWQCTQSSGPSRTHTHRHTRTYVLKHTPIQNARTYTLPPLVSPFLLRLFSLSLFLFSGSLVLSLFHLLYCWRSFCIPAVARTYLYFFPRFIRDLRLRPLRRWTPYECVLRFSSLLRTTVELSAAGFLVGIWLHGTVRAQGARERKGETEETKKLWLTIVIIEMYQWNSRKVKRRICLFYLLLTRENSEGFRAWYSDVSKASLFVYFRLVADWTKRENVLRGVSPKYYCSRSLWSWQGFIW